MNDKAEYPKTTFIDVYYKGFHAGITCRGNEIATAHEFVNQAMQIKLAAEQIIEEGFKPSWNNQTNGDALTPKTPTITPQVIPQAQVAQAFNQSSPNVPDVTPVDLGVCKKCGGEMVVNPKTDKVFCANKCWLKS